MKRICLALTSTVAILGLAACKEKTIEVPEQTVDPVVPTVINTEVSLKRYYNNSISLYTEEYSAETFDLLDYVNVKELGENVINSDISKVKFDQVGTYEASVTVTDKSGKLVSEHKNNIDIKRSPVNDEAAFRALDKSVMKIISIFGQNDSGMERGSGYIIDIDKDNNKFYVATNYHVVYASTKEYVALTTKAIGASNVTFCGKAVYNSVDHNLDELPDFAIVEVSGYTLGVSVDSQVECKKESVKPLDFTTTSYANSFERLQFANTKLITNDYYEAGKDLYGIGYPSGVYTRTNYSVVEYVEGYTYTPGAGRELLQKYTWLTDVVRVRASFKNSDNIGIPGIIAGFSGSVVVNENQRIVGSIFARATDPEGLMISHRNLIKEVDNFCTQQPYNRLSLCDR